MATDQVCWAYCHVGESLIGRTHLSKTAVSLVGGDPSVLMSHNYTQIVGEIMYKLQPKFVYTNCW
jgi:hypothetical protein